VKVVVSGGAGFLGSHLCDRLIERGDEVVVIDNLVTGRLANIEHLFGHPGFVFQHHDVSNHVHVPGPVDAVMHLASPASPKDFTEIPIKILKVGSLGTHNMLGLALQKGARFFLASTSEVYGDPLVHPQPESYWGNVNPIGPRGVYDEAKRFAEAITMAYHRQHSVDVRIVRIFNSILADEQVLYDDGHELRREAVGELAARLAGRVDLEGYRVPAFDGTGQVAAAEATALVGHAPSGACYEVRTRYGRSIRVTGDHSLFVEGEDGLPLARTVEELQVGDHIAIAGRVDVPERDRTVVDMLEVWDRSGHDAAGIGVCAPGWGELAWERRFEIFATIQEHRRPQCVNWRNSIWGQIRRMRAQDRIPLDVVRRLAIDVPAGATLRRAVSKAGGLPRHVEISDELLWLFGLFVAEGCWREIVPKESYVSITCDRGTLARARKVFERDLGLHVVAGSESRSPSVFVHSRLLLLLLDHLGFLDDEKRIPGWVLGLPRHRLAWFLEGYRVGDGVHSGKKLAEGRRHEFSTVSEALKDDLVVAFARFGLVPSIGYYSTTLRQRTGERRYPFWRLTLANVSPWSPLDWASGVTQRLNARRTGDLVWARVESVRSVEATALVYDFCVPDRENFWAGSGVMAHNTYGPKMRPDDGRVVSNFLCQALTGKPITIYGDGSQTRSFTYVDDEVRGFLALLDSDVVGPTNIGNPNEFTVRQLAELVLEVTRSSSELILEPLPVDDPTQRKPDITRASSLLGWEPRIELREGLEKTAAWFRDLV
jgi:nucleoside-diphosphate-sugar epimerase/intein/homing endonuclease